MRVAPFGGGGETAGRACATGRTSGSGRTSDTSGDGADGAD